MKFANITHLDKNQAIELCANSASNAMCDFGDRWCLIHGWPWAFTAFVLYNEGSSLEEIKQQCKQYGYLMICAYTNIDGQMKQLSAEVGIPGYNHEDSYGFYTFL